MTCFSKEAGKDKGLCFLDMVKQVVASFGCNHHVFVFNKIDFGDHPPLFPGGRVTTIRNFANSHLWQTAINKIFGPSL